MKRWRVNVVRVKLCSKDTWLMGGVIDSRSTYSGLIDTGLLFVKNKIYFLPIDTGPTQGDSSYIYPLLRTGSTQ